MSINYNSNRRKTKRHTLNLQGILNIINEKDGTELTEKVEVANISYKGLGIVFSNNNFLLDFLSAYKDETKKVILSFDYEENKFIFETKIYWVRVYELGERNFYAASCLLCKNFEAEEEKIMEILLDLELDYVYLI